MYRADLIAEHGLAFGDIRIVDDALFDMFALLYAKRISVTNDRLVYYRCNNTDSQQGQLFKTPQNMFDAYGIIKDRLTKCGLYKEYEQSFVNRAVAVFRNNLSIMRTGDSYEWTYNALKEKEFAEFGIINDRDYYHIKEDADWVEDIYTKTAAGFLFEKYYRLREHNGNVDKVYAFPEEDIPSGSIIAVYGAGRVGRDYVYSIMTKRDYKLGLWVDRNYESIGYPVVSPEELKNASYDKILIAIENDNIKAQIKEFIISIGLAKEKIV